MFFRHHSAEGDLRSCWDYDAARAAVLLILRLQPAIVVDVCSARRPRFGAFPIFRVDETTWKIEPARYTARSSAGDLETVSAPIAVSIGVQVVSLLAAPERVSAKLSELAVARDSRSPPETSVPCPHCERCPHCEGRETFRCNVCHTVHFTVCASCSRCELCQGTHLVSQQVRQAWLDAHPEGQ